MNDPTQATPETDTSQKKQEPSPENNHKFVVVAFASLFVVLIVALTRGLGQDPKTQTSALIGQPAQDFTVEVLQNPLETKAQNNNFSLSYFAGKPLIINFWASWCVSCRAEAAQLEAFWQETKGSEVNLIGIAIQDESQRALAFAAQFGKTYPLALDQTGMAAVNYGVVGVPETFFVDDTGVIRFKHTGPIDQETLKSYVKKMTSHSPTQL